MRKTTLMLLLAGGISWAAQGQTLFDSGAAGYSGGNLAGQNNWAKMLNTDTNGVPYPAGQSNQLGQVAFEVDNTSWINTDTATVDADFLTTTNGSFVYLNEVSGGNAEDQVWTSTMDFSLAVPDNGGLAYAMPNGEFFYVGLTAATNGSLSKFDRNDMCFVLRVRAENGRLDLNLQDGAASAQRILQIKPENLGWAPEAVMDDGTPVPADYQTDTLRLTMTLRKTRNAGSYTGSAVISNLTTGFSYDGLEVVGGGTPSVQVESSFSTNCYNASDVKIAMGRSSDAWRSQLSGNGLIDIDVEALSVVKSSVPPPVTAPQNVSSSPYDSQVTLSWDAVNEVSSYNVLRSTTPGGPYSTVTNLTGTALVDNSVVNNTTYYYVIQSDFGVSGTADSAEIAATPKSIFTGSLIATDFSGDANGDLVNSPDWVQVSGSSNNAFNVINSGTVTAAIDTVSTAANFSTNTGNAVYLDKLTDNQVYDAWEGHIDFQVSAANTNINNQDVLAFGVSADNSRYLDLTGDDSMALMSIKVRANGKLVAMFGTELNDSPDTRLAVLIGQSETGWDPANTSAPDLESDWIRYNWKIRKTGVEGVYQAFGSFSNLSTVVTNPAQTGVSFLTVNKPTMYNNPSATFVMGHYYKARLQPDKELVNVAIREMSVSHSSGNQPALTPPAAVTTIGGDRSVAVSWGESLEATDYDLLLAESAGGAQTVVTNLAGLNVLDTPRFNGVTNWYTVRAHFPNGSADSAEVAGVPFASVTALNFDGTDTSLTSGQVNLGLTVGLQTNGAVTFIDNTMTPLIANGEGGYTGPTFHGLTQIDKIAADITDGRGDIGFRMANNQNNNGWLTDNFEYRQNGGAPRGECLWYVESTDWAEPSASVDAVANTVGVLIANKLLTSPGTHQIAVRNGTTWYVSQASALNGTSGKLETDGTLLMTDIASGMFGQISVSPGTLIAQPTVWDTGANWGFNNITAIGWFADNQIRIKPVKLIITVGGSIPSTQYWMNQYANVTNLTDNTDGDALSNIKEYALGGNPEDPNDLGTLPELTAANVGGTNGFTFVHVELRDPQPGISYSVETTTDLVNLGFAPGEAVVIGEENIDYYFKAVTNFIPADAAAKFIDLKVTETP